VIPGYQAATATRWAAWRQENAALLAQVETTPDFHRMLAENDRQPPLTSAAQRQAQEQCENAADLLGPAGPPDPRLATPEQTWAHFQASLRAGDRGTASGCMILQAKLSFKATAQRLTDQDLRKIADAAAAFLAGDNGDAQEAEFVRNGVGYRIGFQRVRGESKIATM
jgi:hypothetical protein